MPTILPINQTCPVCQGKGKAGYATPYRDVEKRECYSPIHGFGTETTTRTGVSYATQTCVNCMGTGESRKPGTGNPKRKY